MSRSYRARITAVVANAPECPVGTLRDILELHVCLTDGSRLSRRGDDFPPYRIRGLLNDDEIWSGVLVADGEHWRVCRIDDDDEPLCSVDLDAIRPGEHITLRQHGNVALVYRIVNL